MRHILALISHLSEWSERETIENAQCAPKTIISGRQAEITILARPEPKYVQKDTHVDGRDTKERIFRENYA